MSTPMAQEHAVLGALPHPHHPRPEEIDSLPVSARGEASVPMPGHFLVTQGAGAMAPD